MTSHEIPAHSAVPSVPARERSAPEAGAPASGLDRATLERVRERDPEALGRLFDRYFDQVFGLVLRLLGDRTLAEDATSDVFLKVHRASHQIDPARDPAPWLMTIATNVCRDLWRSGAYRMSRRSAPVEEESPAGVQLTPGTNDPERDTLAGERERLVHEALARLPEPLRVAVVLHDWQGLSHQEVADITGIEHAAARKRYSRALAALATLLKDRLA